MRLAAPPVDGAANEELERFLAERLSVPRSRVALRRGMTSRTKQVEIVGLTPEEVAQRLGVSWPIA